MTIPQQPAERQQKNGLGLTALILGIIGLSLSFIPFVNYVSVVLGVIGFLLAVVGFVRIRRGGANNPVVTTLGGLASVAAVVVAFIAFNAFLTEVDKGVDEMNREMAEIEEDFESTDKYLECVDAVELDDPEFDAKMDECDALTE